MYQRKIYHVRVLDFKYQSDFGHLNFQYLTYKVIAKDEKEAVEKAQVCYMKGQKEAFSEELPFMFKLYAVTRTEDFNIVPKFSAES